MTRARLLVGIATATVLAALLFMFARTTPRGSEDLASRTNPRAHFESVSTVVKASLPALGAEPENVSVAPLVVPLAPSAKASVKAKTGPPKTLEMGSSRGGEDPCVRPKKRTAIYDELPSDDASPL